MDQLDEKLLIYAQNNLNVMLIGRHGVGKTVRVKAIAEKLNIGSRFKYYSASTLDPYSEFIGVPVPNKEDKSLDFYRPKELNNAEFIFFDELNRVTNPRILNTVLEIIQFKTINGDPLKNLKMVWAAINPPGDYQVEELDPALEDRFHTYVRVHANISLEYFKTKMSANIASAAKGWWDGDLDDEQRKIITPRRMEYIGCMIDKGIPWKDALPVGHTFPSPGLDERLKYAAGDTRSSLILTRDGILSDVGGVLSRLKEEPKHAIGITNAMKSFNIEDLYKTKDIIEELPKELVMRLGDNKFEKLQLEFRKYFETDIGEGFGTQYPKIFEAFNFGEK